MPKRPLELFLVDILVAIDRIKRNAATLSFDLFVADENIFNSTMRDFEIIGEAVRNLLKMQNDLKSSRNVEWQKIVDFRNLITHQYFGVVPKMVFGVIHEEVPKLEKEIIESMKRRRDQKNLIQALADAKDELAKMNRKESIVYIKEIEAIIASAS